VHVHQKDAVARVPKLVSSSMDQLYYGLMQRLQAFKFQLQPNGAQERNLHRFAGARRFVYNEALALQKQRHEWGESKLSYAGLCKLLTQWRNKSRGRR
jgi:putative transposase